MHVDYEYLDIHAKKIGAYEFEHLPLFFMIWSTPNKSWSLLSAITRLVGLPCGAKAASHEAASPHIASAR